MILTGTGDIYTPKSLCVNCNVVLQVPVPDLNLVETNEWLDLSTRLNLLSLILVHWQPVLFLICFMYCILLK